MDEPTAAPKPPERMTRKTIFNDPTEGSLVNQRIVGGLLPLVADYTNTSSGLYQPGGGLCWIPNLCYTLTIGGACTGIEGANQTRSTIQ